MGLQMLDADAGWVIPDVHATYADKRRVQIDDLSDAAKILERFSITIGQSWPM